ncbi:hypothetical protein ACEPAG_3756 [Sanghuangporus baumii]
MRCSHWLDELIVLSISHLGLKPSKTRPLHLALYHDISHPSQFLPRPPFNRQPQARFSAMASLIVGASNAITPSGTLCDIHVRSIEVKFKDGPRKYPVSIITSFGENGSDKSKKYGRNENVHWLIEKQFASGSQFIVRIRLHHSLRTVDVMTIPVSVSELMSKPFFEISDSNANPISLKIHSGSVGPFIDVIRRLVEQSQAQLETMKIFLERLGRVCEALDYVVTITEAVSSVHPAAEAAASAATKLLDCCRKLQECHASASELMEDVATFLPFTDIPEKGLKCKVTARTTEEMLVLFESICKAIIKSSSRSVLGGLWDDRIEEIQSFKENLRKLKETFGWCLTTEIWKTTLKIEKNTDILLLRKALSPLTEAAYREDRLCFEGSRRETLKMIETWSESESSPKLFWLHGTAGNGKTAIAHTVAKLFHSQNRLVACFSLNERQNSERIMPTIAYHLAKWHPDYQNYILDILRSSQETVVHSGLEGQFELLMKRPISEIAIHSPPTHKPLIVVLDALENCYDSEDCRRSFIDYLVGIAMLVPWLKVFITSRKSEVFELCFRRVRVQSLLIDDALLDLRHDIAAYSRLCMERRDSAEKWTPGMKNGVQGLFFRISMSLVALSAVRSAETLCSANDFGDIDGFFRVVIKGAIERENFHDDDILVIRRILAVVSCMTPIQPPTREALCHVLQPIQPGITPDHLDAVISRLSPIVYTNNEDIPWILFPTDIFLNFLLKEYQSDVESIKRRLALHALHAELKFNVCGLGNPQLANKNVPDLKEKLDSHVSETLRYCSLHWMDLVAKLDDIQACDEAVIDFLCSPKVIFWIEVLSLLGELDTGKSILSKCVDHFKDEDRIVDAATNLLAFISEFEPAIALSAPHIYISILSWIPSDSPIRSGIKSRASKIVFESFPKPASDAVTIDSNTGIVCTTRSPDGDRIVSGSRDGRLGIWDGLTGARIGEEIKGHTRRVYDVRYSPDGSRFVSRSADGTVKIWDVTGKLVTKMESDSVVWSVAISPNGRRVVSGHGDGTLRIWDAQNGGLIAKWRGHESSVFAVAYSPDGTMIVSGSRDKSVRIWDAQRGAAVGEPLIGHEDWVCAVAYSPDGSRIVSGSDDATVRIWDAHTGNQIGEPLKGHERWVVDVGYSQDGSRIISASYDDTIRFWNATSGDSVDVLRRGESRWDAEAQHFVSIPSWWPASSWKSFSIQSLVYSSSPLYVPDDGWIRTLDGGLLLWVPPQHRHCSCHAAPESTITANDRDERLKTSAWKDIPQGANWAKMMNVEESD